MPNLELRPPLPPNVHRSPVPRRVPIGSYRSPSPMPGRSRAHRSLSHCSSSSSLYLSCMDSLSVPIRRIFPQEYDCQDIEQEISEKEQAPVVFDASLNFVLGLDKQKVRQNFKPTASHLEPTTASSYLSAKIANFLQRTDHIMDEWRSLGRNGDDYSRRSTTPYSKSSTNIRIRGFQYYSRASSVAKSPSRSRSCFTEDRTLSESNAEVLFSNRR